MSESRISRGGIENLVDPNEVTRLGLAEVIVFRSFYSPHSSVDMSLLDIEEELKEFYQEFEKNNDSGNLKKINQVLLKNNAYLTFISEPSIKNRDLRDTKIFTYHADLWVKNE